MTDFKAKMHQIRFWLGLRWGSLQRSPDPLAGFGGLTSKGGERRERGWREGEGKRGKHRGGERMGEEGSRREGRGVERRGEERR